MDSQDHRKNHTTGHESHGVHVCHNCGWPFPNPHPSAKHRRAHKKVCGTVEGYKLTDAEQKTLLDVAGEEDQLSDEDHKASGNSELGESKSNENMKNGIHRSKSTRSEEELFSDTVREFGESGTSPTVETVEGAQNPDVNVNASIIQEPEHPMQVSQLQNPQGSERSVDNLKKNVQFQDDTSSPTIGSVSASSDKKTEALDVDATNGRHDSTNLISDVKREEPVNVIPEITHIEPGDDLTDRSMMHSGQSSEGQQHGNNDAGHLPHIVFSPSKPACVVVSERDSKLEQMNEFAGVTNDVSTTRTNGSVLVDTPVDLKQEQSNFSETETIQIDTSSNSCSEPMEGADIEHVRTLTDSKSDASGQAVDIVYPGEIIDVHNVKVEPNEKVAALSIPTVMPAESLSDMIIKDCIDHGPGTTGGHDEVTKEMEDQPQSLASVEDDFSFLHSEFCSAQRVLEENHQKQGTVNKSIAEERCIECKTDTSGCKVETSLDDGSNESQAFPDALGSDKTCTHEDQTQVIYSTEKQEILPDRLIHGTGGAAMVSPANNEVDGASNAICSSNFSEKATVSTANGGSNGAGSLPDALSSDITSTHTGITQTVCSIEKQEPYDSHHDLPSEIPPEKPTVIQETHIAAVVFPTDTEVDDASNAFSNGEFPEKATISTGNRSNGLETLPDSEILPEKPTVIPESGADAMVSPAHSKVNGASLAFSSSDDFPEKARNDNSNIAGKYVGEGVVEAIGTTNLMISPKFAAELSNTEPHLNATVICESDKNVGQSEDLQECPKEVDISRCTDSSSVTKLESQAENGDTNGRVSEPLHEDRKVEQDNSGLFQSGAENLRLDEHIPLNSGPRVPSSVAVEDNNADDLSGDVTDINSQSLQYDGDHNLKNQLGTPASDVVREEFSVDSDGQTNHIKGYSESVSGPVASMLNATDDSVILAAETLQASSDVEAQKADLKKTLGEESTTKDFGKDIFEIKSQSLPPDASVDSGSQTDSVDGHWGSVSDGTFPSTRDANEERAIIATETPDTGIKDKDQRTNLETKNGACEKQSSDHSDIFDAPSFMTLVESGYNRGIDQQTASSSEQAGWFPSLTHDVKESLGRKKNEEIIAKVSNWSAGKPHAPLKSLLVEANLESKPKPPTAVAPKHEAASAHDNSNLPAKASPPPVTAPEASTAFVAKVNEVKEWNTPAKLPENKKEKRKARGNWVPFVCCTSVDLDP